MTKRDLKSLLRIRLDYFNKVMIQLGRMQPDSFIVARLKELQPQVQAAADACTRVADLERMATSMLLAYQAADLLIEGRPGVATELVLALEQGLDSLSVSE